jgi:hypothetical protein
MPVSTTNGIWMTCQHVEERSAKEVWARPDGIAVCRECAQSDPDTIPMENFHLVCTACLLESLCSVQVLGREYIERDALRHGHNHEWN